MSTCAFCGDRHITGRNYLAHRMTSSRIRTVKVCARCVDEAQDAGYYVTEREAAVHGSSARPSSSLRLEQRYQ